MILLYLNASFKKNQITIQKFNILKTNILTKIYLIKMISHFHEFAGY